MPIQESNLTFYPSALVSYQTASQNGGVMAGTGKIVTNVMENLFPNISNSERSSGSGKRRKVFAKIETDPLIAALNGKVFIDKLSSGDDYFLLHFTGSQIDVESDLSNPRHYGIGTLKTDVAVGATSLTVVLEHAGAESLQPFKANDALYIAAKESYNSNGNAEFVTVSATEVNYSNGEASILLAAGTKFAWSAGANVASVITVSEVKPTAADFIVTSAAGTFTSTGNVTLNGFATIHQTWTLTITDGATGSFRLDGDTLGSGVATGNIGSDFAPNNGDFSKPFFTLAAAGWGGSWATNDTLEFSTDPAALPFWVKRVVPAGAASTSYSALSLAFVVESL
ncbi:MAG: hypothetical protein HQL51_03900 [Magnetococcales bacterium]|nr:hypothetical protein [Magnetococcales bacterium]